MTEKSVPNQNVCLTPGKRRSLKPSPSMAKENGLGWGNCSAFSAHRKAALPIVPFGEI